MAKKSSTLSYLDILLDIRDSRLARNSELILLLNLALRVTPAKGYSCFPGYPLLSQDTGLDITTVKRAARALEARDLISRKIRHNHSNVWYLNVKVIRKAAEVNRSAAKSEAEDTGSSPFDLTGLVDEDVTDATPVASSKDVTPDAEMTLRSKEDAETIAEIKALLQDRFGDHPTYQVPNADAIMTAAVEKCIALAGSVLLCKSTFLFAFDPAYEGPRIATIMQKVKQLGGYLQACFPDWLKELEANRTLEFAAELQAICKGESTIRHKATKGKRFYYESLVTYLKNELGDDLLSVDTEDDGDEHVLTISISDAARERILTEAEPEPQVESVAATMADDLD